MLRITADDKARILTFRLEGRLEGPWVRELEECWRSMMDAVTRPTISVDLTGVTYIDAAGKTQLADMHEQGAQFVANDCMTKAVVEEVVGRSNESVTSRSGPRLIQRAKEIEHDTARWESSSTDQADGSGTGDRRRGRAGRQRPDR